MATIDTTEKKIQDWRTEVFANLGFNQFDADLLAVARDWSTGYLVDSDRIRKLIRQGCSHDLVKRIVL